MPATTGMRRSGAQLSVSPQTHTDIDEMRRDMQAEFRRDVTQDEVVRSLMEDSHRLGNVDDMILAAIESFSEAEAEGMTSLPIGDVLGFLGELKAAIEGDFEDISFGGVSDGDGPHFVVDDEIVKIEDVAPMINKLSREFLASAERDGEEDAES